MCKKVFISYAWGTEDHNEWVRKLGTRLLSDSIDVELDSWSLKDGQDIYKYMETMVDSDSISKVLIICDKNYVDKSSARKGGVGTEAQIITPHIYANHKQEKFIPLIKERDEKENPYLPTFLSSRKYIDFSSEEIFEDSYEELLRNIVDKPTYPKPKLGSKLPAYITDESPNNSELDSKLRTIKSQLDKKPERINNLASEFIEIFEEKLREFEITKCPNTNIELGKTIFDNLISYKSARDSFIDFLLIITSSEYSLDIDKLIGFFESQPKYLRPSNNNSWRDGQFENYEVMFHELFIYTIAACLRNNNYQMINQLFFSKYLIEEGYQREYVGFTFICKYHENLYEYILSNSNSVAGFGQYLINNIGIKINKELVILADVICYINCQLYPQESSLYYKWFPYSYIFSGSSSHNKSFDFLTRIQSKRHFEKIKAIFQVNTAIELKNILNDYSSKNDNQARMRYSNHSYINFPHELIDAEKIAIYE